MAKTGFEKFAEKSNPVGRVAIQRPAAERRQEREAPVREEVPKAVRGIADGAGQAVASPAAGGTSARRGRPRKGETPQKDSYQMHILVNAETKARLEEEMRRRHMSSLTSVIMMAVYEFLDRE